MKSEESSHRKHSLLSDRFQDLTQDREVRSIDLRSTQHTARREHTESSKHIAESSRRDYYESGLVRLHGNL